MAAVNRISKYGHESNRPFYLGSGCFSWVERQRSLSPLHTPMGCYTASFWLCSPAPVAVAGTATGSSKLYKLSTIFCCVNSSADSSWPTSVSTGSSGRRWYNHLKKSSSNQQPEIARHWIDTDHPFPSQGIFGCCSREI